MPLVDQRLQPGAIGARLRAEDAVAGAQRRLVRARRPAASSARAVGGDARGERVDRRAARRARRRRAPRCRTRSIRPGKASRKKPEMRNVTSTRGRSSTRRRQDLEAGDPAARAFPDRARARSAPAPARCRRRRCACWRCPRPTARRAPGSRRAPGRSARPAAPPISSRAARPPGSAPRGYRANRNCARSATPRAGRGVGAPRRARRHEARRRARPAARRSRPRRRRATAGRSTRSIQSSTARVRVPFRRRLRAAPATSAQRQRLEPLDRVAGGAPARHPALPRWRGRALPAPRAPSPAAAEGGRGPARPRPWPVHGSARSSISGSKPRPRSAASARSSDACCGAAPRGSRASATQQPVEQLARRALGRTHAARRGSAFPSARRDSASSFCSARGSRLAGGDAAIAVDAGGARALQDLAGAAARRGAGRRAPPS